METMTQEDKEAILKIWKIHQRIRPEFSCTLCKAKINPPTCQGCPIYCQTFSLD